ncbi:polycystic kidney disease protein 1-like 2 [Pangasianodon hypophthalmus]|uniref:polycystic kidney disease protein 1-like 2 n=1 Tax=Pangasianodon hypophthalmus TaxID=310915 RepID=UPI0023070BF7|nr:polycystic kidney disease protein 1-like 2 [Pangasianodon hypophthalmus]
MPFLRKLCIYCWISGTFLLSAHVVSLKTSRDVSDDQNFNKAVFRDVVYEFVAKPHSWGQASEACEIREGKLLKYLDCEIKDFFSKVFKDLQTAAPGWWISEGLTGYYEECVIQAMPTAQPADRPSPHFCTYVTMDPFQLVTTPYCNMTLGYLCTQDSQADEDENKRVQRSIRVRRSTNPIISEWLQQMDSSTSDLVAVLTIAKQILNKIANEPVEIAHDSKKLYLKDILKALKALREIDDSRKDLTINCTGGLILHTVEQCEPDDSPEHLEELLILATLIYQQLNILTQQNTNTVYVWDFLSGTLFTTRQEPKNLDTMVIGNMEQGVFHFPSFDALKSQLPAAPVDVQMFSYKTNPLSEQSNFSITGTVCSLSLSADSSNIKLSNLSSFIEIFLPRPEAPEPELSSVSLKYGFALITSFNITDPNATVIVTAIPDQNVSLQLLLSPTYQSNNHSQRTILTGHADNYQWIIHPEMMNSTNGTMYVNVTLFNYTSSRPVTVSISLMNFKCVYWDVNQKDWSRDGCWVGPKTVPKMTHCLCNHNTFYGSSFFVMPNPIDLSQTAALFATINQNYVVVSVLCGFFFLYLILVLWAWYADKKALRTRKVMLLEDNHPCAHYNYLLNIQTGNRKRAGTSAKVMMTLEGTDGESDIHHLAYPDQPVFEKGGVDMFMLSTPFSLGELQNIKLWHDNTGGDPDWYLQKVTVQDLQTRQVWHFLCNTWLKGNGDTPCKRTFNPAKKNEITSFGNLFHARTSTGFRDEHIWISIVNPPRHSPFTRVQRVSCCMCLLLCTMVINIMFWNIPKDGESPVIIKLGSFELTWQQIMVAVESALLMFPINILIVTIFRSIQPRVKKDDKDMPKTNKSDKSSVTSMQTILKDTQDIVNLLSKSPKNCVIALQENLETTADLFAALNQMHDVIVNIQGQTVGDQHWAHCSRFVFHTLCHLSTLLDRAGEKVFPHPEDLDLAKNTVNMMLKKAEVLTSTHPVQSFVPVQEKKTKSGCKLPWWFVFVGWGLLITISGISTFFTLLYGFQYGKESSIRWVITLTLSMFQSIFIIQPLKVVGLAIFFALILRPVAVEDNQEVELLLDEQREKCESYCGRHMH